MFTIHIKVQDCVDIIDPLVESCRDVAANSVELDNSKIFQTIGKPRIFRLEDKMYDEIRKSKIDFLPILRSNFVCIIALPHYIKSIETYFNSWMEDISYIRVVQYNKNPLLLLLSFQDQQSADRFYVEYNGKEFQEDSFEFCYTTFIQRIIFTSTDIESIKEMVELPTCVMCLERIAIQQSGIPAVIRTECLYQAVNRWQQALDQCIICQRTDVKNQELQVSPTNSIEEDYCTECQHQSSDLWGCLICQHIGCGRNEDAHSVMHFEETMHRFSIELSTQRVWDYKEDCYVHRLVHKGSNVIVIDCPESPQDTVKANQDIILQEYNYLISVQLEQQRELFEKQLNKKMRNQGDPAVLIRLTEENKKLRKQLRHKALARRKNDLMKSLATMQEENAFLEELNKNLQDQAPTQMKFQDKKSQYAYLKLERLRKRVEELMNKLG